MVTYRESQGLGEKLPDAMTRAGLPQCTGRKIPRLSGEGWERGSCSACKEFAVRSAACHRQTQHPREKCLRFSYPFPRESRSPPWYPGHTATLLVKVPAAGAGCRQGLDCRNGEKTLSVSLSWLGQAVGLPSKLLWSV